MRLTLDLRVDSLQAMVIIKRAGNTIETLAMLPISPLSRVLESAVAPAEPHEFAADPRLTLGAHNFSLPFAIVEPLRHSH